MASDKNTSKNAFLLISLLLILATFIPTSALLWRWDVSLETVLGTSAVLLSSFVSVLAFIKLITRKKNKYLFIGSGFLGVAILEGYSLVSSLSIGAFVWTASRFLLSAFLLLSLKGWREGEGTQKKLRPRVYVSAAASAFLLILSVSLFPDYEPYTPVFVFGRPLELLGVILFTTTFFLYYAKGYWKFKYFEYWFLISLMTAVFSELSMALSFDYFDVRYNLAHVLKNASYILALIGLLTSSWAAFREVEGSNR